MTVKKYAKSYPAPRERKVPTGPLSLLMKRALVAMLPTVEEWYGMTGNEIGYALGFGAGDVKAHVSGAAVSGGCTRSMGAAQRAIPVIIGLERRGLIQMASRRDGRSGTAYRLTTKGEQEARRIMAEDTNERTDALTAPSDAEAVWIVEGYDTEGTLEPMRAAGVEFGPGDSVTIQDEHEMYGGEKGVVQAAGKGTGEFAGQIVYDVLVEGTSNAERFTADELEG